MEADEQKALVAYCDLKHIPCFAIPNGGYRNKREAAHLKAQGVKAGVPDVCIPVARRDFHGLYIELKYGKNKPSEKQKEWIALLNKLGYKAVVCWGFDEARRAVDWYMSGK